MHAQHCGGQQCTTAMSDSVHKPRASKLHLCLHRAPPADTPLPRGLPPAARPAAHLQQRQMLQCCVAPRQQAGAPRRLGTPCRRQAAPAVWLKAVAMGCGAAALEPRCPPRPAAAAAASRRPQLPAGAPCAACGPCGVTRAKRAQAAWAAAADAPACFRAQETVNTHPCCIVAAHWLSLWQRGSSTPAKVGQANLAVQNKCMITWHS